MAARPAVAVHESILAADGDNRSRAFLDDRIAHLLPVLGREDRDGAVRHVQAWLGMLARDHAAHVRAAVVDAAASLPEGPRDLAPLLGDHDVFEVSDPVLRLAPALTDSDLLALIATPLLARGAGSHLDGPAIQILLANPSVSIQEATLDALVGRAPAHTGWNGMVVRRPCLSDAASDALATLVADELSDVLRTRQALDDVVIDIVRRQAAALDRCNVAERDESSRRECERFKAEGRLDEPFFLAVLRTGNLRRAAACLAVASGVDLGVIDQVVELRNTRALASLVARAGFSMGACLAAQAGLLQLAPDQLLRPGSSGGYPISDDEMQWQLELHLHDQVQ